MRGPARWPGWVGGLLAVAQVAWGAPRVGARAPDFRLRTLSGRSLSLSSLHGKVVVLDFFASWCGPCLDDLPRLVALQRRQGPRGVQVIGISLDDSAAPVRKLVGRFRIDYPVVLGNVEVAERYGGILGMPVVFVIDRSGRLVARHDGAAGVAEAEANLRRLLAPRH